MIFTNPWGFLAFLSIPVILGLHFFRSHRRIRTIGGLHLWQFASTRQPVGNKFTRIISSMSLLFQLLAATLLSLLVAGMDMPQASSESHYTIILDDSVSMLAAEGESAHQKTMDLLEEWADSQSLYTVVLAGIRASVVAGPFAEKSTMLETLQDWRPESPGCDLEPAVQLASRFLIGDEKILFITDSPTQAADFSDLLEVRGLGYAMANNAITFADRVRLDPDTDRVYVTLQTFAAEAQSCRVTARAGDSVIYESEPPKTLDPAKSLSFTFDTNVLRQPITVEIEGDALPEDNQVMLAPAPPKLVRVHAGIMEPLNRYLDRAIAATPYCFMEPDPAMADLVIRATQDFPTRSEGTGEEATAALPVFNETLFADYESALLMCLFPKADAAEASGVSRGDGLLADVEHTITAGLPLEEGILWPYASAANPSSYMPILSHTTIPIIFGGRLDRFSATAREAYYINLLYDRTNIFQTNAWPVLVRNLVEQTRKLLPGMSRTNYRVGEAVSISLDPRGIPEKTGIILRKDGSVLSEYESPDEVPSEISNLNKGYYRLVQSDGGEIATFAMNLFAPRESDLKGLHERKADLAELKPGVYTQEKRSPRLFLVTLLLIGLFTVLSWVFQDSSR
ncbi:MAG: BatA domain-containing protein [Candidatus Sumerlaeia bacterium]